MYQTKKMKTLLRLLLLLIHLAMTLFSLDYVGEKISHPINIFLVFLGGILYTGLVSLLILHISNFITLIKTKKEKL